MVCDHSHYILSNHNQSSQNYSYVCHRSTTKMKINLIRPYNGIAGDKMSKITHLTEQIKQKLIERKSWSSSESGNHLFFINTRRVRTAWNS